MFAFVWRLEVGEETPHKTDEKGERIMVSVFESVDENDLVIHPQTGERFLIPQVCGHCRSENLLPYSVQGDFLPIDGWRQCGDCGGICAPLDEHTVCLRCLGAGGSLIYVAGEGVSLPDCPACRGTGRRQPMTDSHLPTIVDMMRVPAELLREPEDKNRAASEPLDEMMSRLKRRIQRKRSGINQHDR